MHVIGKFEAQKYLKNLLLIKCKIPSWYTVLYFTVCLICMNKLIDLFKALKLNL